MAEEDGGKAVEGGGVGVGRRKLVNNGSGETKVFFYPNPRNTEEIKQQRFELN